MQSAPGSPLTRHAVAFNNRKLISEVRKMLRRFFSNRVSIPVRHGPGHLLSVIAAAGSGCGHNALAAA
jgi:hypothetical protein